MLEGQAVEKKTREGEDKTSASTECKTESRKERREERRGGKRRRSRGGEGGDLCSAGLSPRG
jgi:hypothetical protein